MWRPVVNVRCLLSSIFYFKTRSPTWKTLELVDLTRLADQRAPGILPVLPLLCWDCKGAASYMSRFSHGGWGAKLRSSYFCGKRFTDWDIFPVPTTVYFTDNKKIQYISRAHGVKGQHREVRLVSQVLFSARSWILQTTRLLAPQCQRLAQSDLSETLWHWEAAGGDGIWSILVFFQLLLSCQWYTFTPWQQQGQLSSAGHRLASIPSSESLPGSLYFSVPFPNSLILSISVFSPFLPSG